MDRRIARRPLALPRIECQVPCPLDRATEQGRHGITIRRRHQLVAAGDVIGFLVVARLAALTASEVARAVRLRAGARCSVPALAAAIRTTRAARGKL
jgi:hypothetical protein